MTRSATPTRLSLDRYAALMGLNPIHFANLDDGTLPSSVRPYWNQSLHDELAVYLLQAEDALRDGMLGSGSNKLGLGFDIAPRYRTDILPFVQLSGRWWERKVNTTYGHVQAFGSRATEAIGTATLSFSGSKATANVTASTSGIAAGEVAVYYRVADRADSLATTIADERWRIRELTVKVNGTTVSVAGHKALFAKPSVLEAVNPAAYGDADSFVTQVELVRVYTDPELPVTVQWDQYVTQWQGNPTGWLEQSGAALLVDSASGAFYARPALYVDGAHVFDDPDETRAPERIEVAYLAGYPLADESNGRIDPRLEQAAARLANVISPDFSHWLNDLAGIRWRNDRGMPDEQNPLQAGEEDCPYGLTNGGRHAWRIVRQMQLQRLPF